VATARCNAAWTRWPARRRLSRSFRRAPPTCWPPTRGSRKSVLLGNVGTVTGGIRAFPDARPDDGWLEVGVTTARNPLQWARALGRLAVGRPDRSPLIRITRGRVIDVKLAEPMAYELDGDARADTTRLSARVVPGAITVCVPPTDGGSTSADLPAHSRRRLRSPGR